MIKELKKYGVDYTLLYIEDNAGLRVNIEKLLSKFFSTVYTAEDGREGLDMFKKHKPDIVLTDINMPQMNGLEMAAKITEISPGAKVIVLSAHEEKEYFHAAINAGVFRFLHKPAKTDALIEALYECIVSLQKAEDNLLFQIQLQDIFNYQNNIIMMMKGSEISLVNERFLDFFGVDDVKEYFDNNSLEYFLLEHEDFLYTTDERIWYEEACTNPGKLYHTKVKNKDGEFRHLILKARKIPKKEETYVLSFDDVTELNLMRLFDKNSATDDKVEADTQAVLQMMNIVLENSAEVKVHNFYRGLTITNPAVLSQVDEEETVLKTSYAQLKIVQIVKNMVLSSDVFPASVLIKSVKGVDFDKQTITFSQMQFLTRSATDRKYIRLEPEAEHKISVFHNDRKFTAETRIIDISVASIKVQISALPPGIEDGLELNLAIVLPTETSPLVINTKAVIFRIDEHVRSFDMVLIYELQERAMESLKTYMVRRQMSLIREFKSLEIKA